MKHYQKSTLLTLSLMLLVSCGGSSGGGGGSSSASNSQTPSPPGDLLQSSQVLQKYSSSLDSFSICLSEVLRNYPEILDSGRSESVGACCSTLKNRVLKDNYKDVYYKHMFPDSIAEIC